MGIAKTASAATAAVAAVFLLLVVLVGGVRTDAPLLDSSGACQLMSAGEPTATHNSQFDTEQLTNARIIVGVAEALDLPQRAGGRRARDGAAGVRAAVAERRRSLTATPRESFSSGRRWAGAAPTRSWTRCTPRRRSSNTSSKFHDGRTSPSPWPRKQCSAPPTPTPTRSGRPRPNASPAPSAAAAPRRSPAHPTFSRCHPAPLAGHWPPEEMGPDGLTPRTRYVRDLIKSGFGETNLGGWCPGGCTDRPRRRLRPLHRTSHRRHDPPLHRPPPNRRRQPPRHLARHQRRPARHQVRHLARPHLDPRRALARLRPTPQVRSIQPSPTWTTFTSASTD